MARTRWRRWWIYGACFAAGLTALWFMLRWFEHWQVFHPSTVMEASAADLGRPSEDVTFGTADGVRLNGWFYPAAERSPRARRVFLLCHGNAGNISHRLTHVGALLETGAAVFVFDYRGYGRSQGRPTEEGTYLDAQAAHAWLRGKGYAATNIVALGESLGGGVAAELALRETVGGLVLLNTFTSVPDLGAELYPWLPVRWLGRIRYDTRSKLPRLHVPVLIVAGRHDRLVPFHHATENAAAANEPRLFRPIDSDHNDFVYTDREGYLAALEALLNLTERTRRSISPAALASCILTADP